MCVCAPAACDGSADGERDSGQATSAAAREGAGAGRARAGRRSSAICAEASFRLRLPLARAPSTAAPSSPSARTDGPMLPVLGHQVPGHRRAACRGGRGANRGPAHACNGPSSAASSDHAGQSSALWVAAVRRGRRDLLHVEGVARGLHAESVLGCAPRAAARRVRRDLSMRCAVGLTDLADMPSSRSD
eukprot:scaffold164_cov409-Prasinococcus_capsulatus_cf.AAC.1